MSNKNSTLACLNFGQLIGSHGSVYELNGSGRAAYSERLFSKLSGELRKLNVSSFGKRQLCHYLKFYQTYPQIVEAVNPQLLQSLTAGVFELDEKVRSLTALSGIVPKNILKAERIEPISANKLCEAGGI